MGSLVLLLVQPDLHAKLGRIVNIEILIELFAQVCDRGKLEAKFICNHRFRFPQGEMNADLNLRRSGAAFPQRSSRMRYGMFTQFNRNRDKTVLWVPGNIRRDRAHWH